MSIPHKTTWLFGIVCSLTSFSAMADQPSAWIQLFDGKTLNGWTEANGKPVAKGWIVTPKGELHRETRGGHIVSTKEFERFELRLEYKIAPGGNSGVKYRLTPFRNTLWGLEFQILDDAGKLKNAKGIKSSCGALYALYPPSDKKRLHPAGEWNELRIVVADTRIEHWLNGERVLQVDTATEDWKQRIAKSKYRAVKDFAPKKPTKILLQDHGSKVWFRNVRIRTLAE